MQPSKVGVPDFSKSATTDETADGLFAMEDDYGTSYYFRGAVENNYVKFGKWTTELYRGYNSSGTNYDDYYSLEECTKSATLNKNCEKSPLAGKDMYWRIIRFNGDGSMRIIYDGTSTHANGENSSDRYFKKGQVWNAYGENYMTDAKQVGWMFGGKKDEASTSKKLAQTNETNSDIKTTVDRWYKENIFKTSYNSYVEDAIFCNDRTTFLNDLSTVGGGYAQIETYFGAYIRRIKYTPQFTCSQENDKFTVEESSGGNGALTYPVGLITFDEISTAGGKNVNQSYYLYKGNYYWSYSPSHFDTSDYPYIFMVGTSGSIGVTDAQTINIAVAPVINIKAEYLSQLEGKGTLQSPFTLS